MLHFTQEAREGIGGRLIRPRLAQRREQRVGLRFIYFGKGFLELLRRLRVQRVETGFVYLLAVGGRSANQEIEELRRAHINRSGHAVERWHQDVGQLTQRRELLRAEKARRHLRRRVGRSEFKLGSFFCRSRLRASGLLREQFRRGWRDKGWRGGECLNEASSFQCHSPFGEDWYSQ